MSPVELVGGPMCGTPGVVATGDALPLAMYGRYLLASRPSDVQLAARYEWDPPSGGMRSQYSCRCGLSGCPNYGVEA